MIEYRFEENARISGELAADGMVLLENRDTLLPFENAVKVAVFGSGQLDFSMGGTGSASVFTAYRVGAIEGLEEQEAAGRLVLDREVLNAYRENPAFEESPEFIAAAAARNSAALVILSRNAGEGADRRDVPGDYRLSAKEERLLDLLVASPFARIAVVVNSGGLIDLAWFRRSDKLKSLLLAWQPGMQGGRALARVLCGEVNPSGKLTDTLAESYSCYPSSAGFQEFRQRMDYEEDIFVGYRYFETIPGAAEKVLYPFGFGLSYTTFDVTCAAFDCDGETICCRARVVNTGKRPGREVVQLYSASPRGGALEYPARELRDFAKTGMLAPGEAVELVLELPFADLAAFDDTGVTGAPAGSFVLEAGEYRFHLGDSVRNTVEAGRFTLRSMRVLASPGILLQPASARRLHADGSFTARRSVPAYCDLPMDGTDTDPEPSAHPIMLEEVAAGRRTMREFLAQLTYDELFSLNHGQPSLFPTGTGGFGNLRRYGVPNPQTADGPAGLRKSVPTTCFPCATLVACSWDKDLQFRMGAALGREGIASEVDVLLAPGLNIHRDPLCGRNFEYFSEDPLVAGRSAAALVNGVQSDGLGATLKHFALNNRENCRKITDSVVSERAIREIYLRGFEIAVKTAHPWCIMSSYNLINGVKASCNYNLLTVILRGEWGFDGFVMTDWWNFGSFWHEMIAGNDLKMPATDREEHVFAKYIQSYYHIVPRLVLERNAEHILNVVMRTHRFKTRDFGRVHEVGEGPFRLSGVEMTSVLNGRSKIIDCRDTTGGLCHSRLINIRDTPQELVYFLNVKRAGAWRLSFRVATGTAGNRIAVRVDGRDLGGFEVAVTQPRTVEEDHADFTGRDLQTWRTQGDIRVELPAGECELMVVVSTSSDKLAGVSLNYIDFAPAE